MDNKRINTIVKKLKKGKSEYFDEFYNLTKGNIYYVIKSIVIVEQDAEDIMQDTYISFINNLDKIDDNKNCYYYLLQMARNKSLNHYNANKRLSLTEDFSYIEKTGEMIDNSVIEYIKSNLSSEEWDLVEKCVFYGYKQVELAKMYNMPIATLSYKYNKALSKAKKLYKEVLS